MRTKGIFASIGKMLSYGYILLIVCELAGCGGASSVQSSHSTAPPIPVPLLYILDQNGNLTSIRADGSLQWQHDFTSSWAGQGQFQVVDQTIYVASQSVAALTTSGQQLWTQPLPDRAVALTVRKNVVYVSAGRLLALNARDGSLLWQGDLPITGGPVSQLLLTSSSLLVAGGTTVAAYSLDGKPQWSTDLATNNLGETGDQITALSLVDNVVIARARSMIAAVNIRTGQTIWTRESQVQAMALIQGVLYTMFIDVPDPTVNEHAPTITGLRAIQASTGQQLWQVTTPVNESDTELMTPNGLYQASATSLTAWDLSGKQRWSIPMMTQITQMIVQNNQIFAVAGQQSELLSIDAQTGKQLWKENETEGSGSELQVADHFLWQWNEEDGGVTGHSLQNGSVRWHIATNAIVQMMVAP